MIPRSPAIEDIIRRYLPSFEEVERAVSLHEGFVLQPLECPDAEVARALGAFLEDCGWRVRCIVPEGPYAAHLLDHILSAREGVGDAPLAVIVYGPERPSPALLEGIGALNRKRDTVIQTLRGPLLWCGPPEFHVASWGAMPDFWSVRALHLRLEGARPHVDVAFTPWRWSRFQDGQGDDPKVMERMAADALGRGDAGGLMRYLARFALALAARERIEDALSILTDAVREKDDVLTTYGRADPRLPCRIALARLLIAKGDMKDAARHVASFDPRWGECAYVLALFYADTAPRVFDEGVAADLLREFGQLLGANVMAAHGEALARDGNLVDGARWLGRAIETFGRNSDPASASLAAQTLARVRAALDQSSLALESIREARAYTSPTFTSPLLGGELSATAADLNALRSTLADLYPNPVAIRRVLAEAGVPTTNINFVGSAGGIWFDVLREAARDEALRRLLGVALRDYPEQVDLRLLAARHRA